MGYFNKPIHDILDVVRLGGEDCRAFMTQDVVNTINEAAIDIIAKDSSLLITNEDIAMLNDLIEISNILYNESDMEILPLDDGIYDMLMIIIKRYNPNYQIGARPTSFMATVGGQNSKRLQPFMEIDPSLKDMLFGSDILVNWGYQTPQLIEDAKTGKKKVRSTGHNYPELVGTLDKCKFVLTNDAIEKGMVAASNVEILQRDFFERHIAMGLYGPETVLTMLLELKYDGISIEADVTDRVIAARSRGDTNNDIATDYTDSLAGYPFPNAAVMENEPSFGMKFEAILTNAALRELNYIYGKDYKNARNAVAGLLAGKDAAKWRNYITLVPLSASIAPKMGMDRRNEIEFLNTFYFNKEDKLPYQVISGNYISLLYQIKQFLLAAEKARSAMPFMYDGIVVSFMDFNLIQMLGRVNSVNKWQMAIKFETMKKDTVFLGYDYTVGQNGAITPMIYYKPIEFYGCIHNKSTGSSFARFKTLGLKYGDIITVEYVNDVMPYVVGKAECEQNRRNNNPIIEFPMFCPCCGSPVTVSDKAAFCTNLNCPDRAVARATNMLKKINFKGFSEAAVKKLNIRSFCDLMNIPIGVVRDVLGEKISLNFEAQREKILTEGLYDYQLVGALGFENIAEGTWRTILSNIPIQKIISDYPSNLVTYLSRIRGIGGVTIDTIMRERDVFVEDLKLIASLPSTKLSVGNGCSNGLTIRFTGCRDKELMNLLISKGHNCSEGSVGKNTDVLIVPYFGYTSTKTKNAINAAIVTLPQIQRDPDGVLNNIMMSPR